MKACNFMLLTLIGFALGQTITIQTDLGEAPKCSMKVLKCIDNYWLNYTGVEPHFASEFVKVKITHIIGATAGLMSDETQCAYVENYQDRSILHRVNKPGASKPRLDIPLIVTECRRRIYFPLLGRISYNLPPSGDVRAAYSCTVDGKQTGNPFGVVNALSPFYLDSDYQVMKERLRYCGVEVQNYPYDCPVL